MMGAKYSVDIHKMQIGLKKPFARNVIQKIAVGPDRSRDISRGDAQQMMCKALKGELDEVQIAVFLIALRMKGESMDELLGIYDALASDVKITIAPVDDLWCLVDPFDGYTRHSSMTAFIAPLLAALGYKVLVIGVSNAPPKYGVTSQQIYKLHGVPTHLNAESVAKRISEHGWAYIDQSSYAHALFALQGLRDRVVKRTALTTVERVLSPLRGRRTTRLVLGYVHKAYPSVYSELARTAGYTSALLLKGVEGGLAPSLNKPLRQFAITFDNPKAPLTKIKSVIPEYLVDTAAAQRIEAQSSARVVLDLGLQVLNGEESIASKSLIVAAANIVANFSGETSFDKCVEQVRLSLRNGGALDNFS